MLKKCDYAIDQIIDNLFLGSLCHAKNKELLEYHHITHVLTVAKCLYTELDKYIN